MVIDKINKLALPATIIIASLILGGFIFATQIIKQQSTERQQQVKLQEDRRVEEAKAEQRHKEYIAKRKLECYNIYEKERKQYNNVVNYGYVERCFDYSHLDIEDIPLDLILCRDDTCEIIYKDTKTGKYFSKYY